MNEQELLTRLNELNSISYDPNEYKEITTGNPTYGFEIHKCYKEDDRLSEIEVVKWHLDQLKGIKRPFPIGHPDLDKPN